MNQPPFSPLPAPDFALVAFFNDPALKAAYVARVEKHLAAGDLVRGPFGGPLHDGVLVESGWRGCAVGCTFHDNEAPHEAAEVQIGVPRLLAQLESELFEQLPEGRYQEWSSQFLQAIPVGADLSQVWPRLAVWLLMDDGYGVLRVAEPGRPQAAVQRVAELYQQQLAGEHVPLADWKQAAANAASVDDTATYTAANAAYAAVYAATNSSVDIDNDAGIYAAETVAAAAADTHAYAADTYAAANVADANARHSFYNATADKLLVLLATAPTSASRFFNR